MKIRQKKSPKILSDKIADALTVKPRADIEDDQVFGTKPHTVSRVDFSSSDSENDTAISDFRKRNIKLLSEISKKYEGEVVSRKDLENDSVHDSEDSDSDFDEETTKTTETGTNRLSQYVKETDDDSEESADLSKQHSTSDDDGSDEGESDDYSITRAQKGSSESDENDEEEGFDISQLEEPVKEDFEHMKKANVSEEAKKGACVRNQLLIWEGLLEMRIHLQRCLTTANQLPLPDTFSEMKNIDEFAEESNTAKTNLCNALDKFMALQNMLLKTYPETKTLSSDKTLSSGKKNNAQDSKPEPTESDEEIPSDTEDEEIPSDTDEDTGQVEKTPNAPKPATTKKRKLEEYEREIDTTHKTFKPFRDTTIQKWNEKTRLATAANIKNAPTNTILQQISYILSEREKLVRRTQLKRSEYNIIGHNKEPEETTNGIDSEINPITRDRKSNDEYIADIFDDSDFYHQLLRELIECKSADITDPVQLSRQWIALQQMRSKMKRKVDTKATKGRKIKYVVHNQLVNYMAPEKCLTWTEESANELYSSLFGKLYEQNNIGLNADFENGFKIK